MMVQHALQRDLKLIERKLKKVCRPLEKAPLADFARRHELSELLRLEFGGWLHREMGCQLRRKRNGDWQCSIEPGKWSSSTSGWQGAVTNAIAAVRKRRGWQ